MPEGTCTLTRAANRRVRAIDPGYTPGYGTIMDVGERYVMNFTSADGGRTNCVWMRRV